MIGIILSAGKQSRFKANYPKALAPYKDITILQENVNIMKKYVKKVIVLVSEHENFHYNEIKDATICPIESGGGSGHTLFEFLNNSDIMSPISNDYLLIKWGDCLHNDEELYKALVNAPKNYISLCPLTLEKNPYCQFKLNSDKSIYKVLFSKNNDPIDEEGYHDLSIFLWSPIIKFFLLQFKDKYRIIDRLYNTVSNEFDLLYLYNYYPELASSSKGFVIDNYITLDFNTVEDLKKLEE